MADSSSGVSALLKELSSTSETLNQASSKLTEQIKEVEAALASYNLGVVAWVDLRRTPEEGEMGDGKTVWLHRVERLGYSKKHGKWGLFASSGLEEFDDFEWWLLRDAPRELRILAIDAIPTLLKELVVRGKELTTKVIDTADQAKSIAHSIRSGNKKKKGEQTQ